MEDDLIRVVIVDDQINMHNAIASAVDTLDDIALVGQGSNGEDAIQLCAEYTPDLVLMDIIMPKMDGIEATRIINERFPAIKVIALSSLQDHESIKEMMQAGAIGYLLKDGSMDDLANTIRLVHTGKSVFSQDIAQVLMDPPSVDPGEAYSLTAREVEVLSLMVSGLNNSEIAAKMIVSRSTVKFHVGNIFNKLNVSGRVEAVALAVEKKLIS